MRDHDLKNKVGKIEDETTLLAREMRDVSIRADRDGAHAHAEFYDRVADHLDRAVKELVSAYSLLLNGDGDAIEPLDDEREVEGMSLQEQFREFYPGGISGDPDSIPTTGTPSLDWGTAKEAS